MSEISVQCHFGARDGQRRPTDSCTERRSDPDRRQGNPREPPVDRVTMISPHEALHALRTRPREPSSEEHGYRPCVDQRKACGLDRDPEVLLASGGTCRAEVEPEEHERDHKVARLDKGRGD